MDSNNITDINNINNITNIKLYYKYKVILL